MQTDPSGVLIVEDYEPWRRFLRSTLSSHSFLGAISEASDGPEAVEQAEALQPQLILLDIGLPTFSGIEAARRIRKLAPESRILFVSQESSPDIVKTALCFGEGYVAKMDAGRELMPAVHTVLQGEQFVSSRLSPRDLPQQTNSTQRLVHVVQFYTDDEILVGGIAALFKKTLDAGASAIGVMTQSHRLALIERLTSEGVNVPEVTESGRLVLSDAEEELAHLMEGDGPNRERFFSRIVNLIRKAQAAAVSKGSNVVVFGEMVAVLWAQKRRLAAIRFEQLWNELGRVYPFYLCCAYPAQAFQEPSQDAPRSTICTEHSDVVSTF